MSLTFRLLCISVSLEDVDKNMGRFTQLLNSRTELEYKSYRGKKASFFLLTENQHENITLCYDRVRLLCFMRSLYRYRD